MEQERSIARYSELLKALGLLDEVQPQQAIKRARRKRTAEERCGTSDHMLSECLRRWRAPTPEKYGMRATPAAASASGRRATATLELKAERRMWAPRLRPGVSSREQGRHAAADDY
eukprot:2098763-Prymnesium_polylepis.2